ncbi:MAG: type II toxin-antitoxin system mRNA interferase toxin, RelE/StbE family [Nitrospirae bacterium]|nr:type II toxin-antitoxin system mRNA interferase toxin, RelE/StbE family [Nitrospirota bacterium]
MSYKDEYHLKIKSDLKKLDKSVAREIYNTHLDKIMIDPYNNERLHGDMESIFSYHFRKNKVDYRIAYSVDESKKVVYFLMMGKRESFYEILKRRLS